MFTELLLHTISFQPFSGILDNRVIRSLAAGCKVCQSDFTYVKTTTITQKN